MLPDLKLSDFSPDTLADLLTLYAKSYIALDGFWYLTIKERVGNEEALACDISNAKKVCQYEMAKITRQVNIQGNDVIALIKAIQLTPWLRHTQYAVEVRDGNNARFTVTHCPTLDALEREGEGRENEICNIVCPKTYKAYASFFNPNIEAECLKLPPRKSKDEICCQWELSCHE